MLYAGVPNKNTRSGFVKCVMNPNTFLFKTLTIVIKVHIQYAGTSLVTKIGTR